MGLRSDKLIFISVLNFRRVTHFRLCLLETQVSTIITRPTLARRWNGIHGLNQTHNSTLLLLPQFYFTPTTNLYVLFLEVAGTEREDSIH